MEKEVSRRDFFNKGAKGAVALAYVAPVVMTVALNDTAHAGGKSKGGNSSSEVGGKGKGKD